MVREELATHKGIESLGRSPLNTLPARLRSYYIPERPDRGPCFRVRARDLEEQKRIEHQIELATRVATYVKDETTVQQLINFAEELKQKLFQTMRRPQVKARSYELWEQAGRPEGRNVEFWLEAERRLKEERQKSPEAS